MKTKLSFEFFPPKTSAGNKTLHALVGALSLYQPDFFSVTYGAGGSTQLNTESTVTALQTNTEVAIAPHLSCISNTKENITKMLSYYQQCGFQHLVALRGDLPSGMGGGCGDFAHANELVAFIRAMTQTHFTLYVAAYPEFHPEANNACSDLAHFIRKVNAGADAAITQYFYNSDAYFRFVELCDKQGVSIPIIPGIMPIHNFVKLERFSKRCGAEMPRWLLKRLQAYENDRDSMQIFAIDVIVQLCETLLKGGAPGLHFYTLNQLQPTLTIVQQLYGGKICKELTLESSLQVQ